MENHEYMPLDGEELLKVIERKIGGVLRKYGQYFGKHLVRHNPWIRVAVKVECFTPEGTPTDGGFEITTPLCDIIFEPDRVREECGLGVYETKLVDEPSGTLAQVKVGERPDPSETIAKVDRLLAKADEEKKESKPVVKAKAKKAKRRGGSGWPKGKPRGSKKTVDTIGDSVAAPGTSTFGGRGA